MPTCPAPPPPQTASPISKVPSPSFRELAAPESCSHFRPPGLGQAGSAELG